MRSCLYVPGNSEKMLGKAPTLPADLITLDLEDSVPLSEKPTARALVASRLEAVGTGGASVYVRVNGWDTRLTVDDLNGVVRPGLDGIVLAKCGHPDEIIRLDQRIGEFEAERGIEGGSVAVQLLIETASGVIHAYECATASERVNSLIFGALDYTRDMRVVMSDDGRELDYARAHIAIAARAAECTAIDYLHADFTDLEGFERTTLEGRALGYEGRLLIHPAQVKPANRLYSPSDEDVTWACGVVEAFETEALAKGLAAITYRGKMIDTPIYETAKALLDTVSAIAQHDRRFEMAD